MTLPSFLGIGAQKCGTSWLAHVLSGHPALYLPEVARELHYFDTYFERGADWYEDFFARAPAGATVGEVTPSYIFRPQAAARIAETLPDCRLIAILRDPVDRLRSQYRMAYAKGRFTGDLEAFLASDETALPRGYYGEQLERYLEHFPPERLLVLIYEEVFADSAANARALAEIAEFLEIDPAPFAGHDASTPVNENTGAPRLRGAYHLSLKVRQKLRDWDMNWALDLARAVGVKRTLFGATRPPPELSEVECARLAAAYAGDRARLEALLGRKFEQWTAAA